MAGCVCFLARDLLRRTLALASSCRWLGESKNALVEAALGAISTGSQVNEPLLVLRDAHSRERRPGQCEPRWYLGAQLRVDSERRSKGLRFFPYLLRTRSGFEIRTSRVESGFGFVIELDGTVSHSTNGGSDFVRFGSSLDASFCSSTNFSSHPEDGIVTVVYPIMLSPG